MKNKKPLTVFLLAMICFAATGNIANIPLTALYGFSGLFYFAFSAIFFFIPLALVSAELATGWPQSGGIYLWVKKAFGSSFGFIAIWLQWVQNLAWFPTMLIFIASTFGFIIFPELASNKIYIFSVFIIVFWSITLLNFFGVKTSGLFSTICITLGTIFPGIFIVILGIIWMIKGYPKQIVFSFDSLVPSVKSFSQLALLASFVITTSGMEMPAVHAKDVQNPRKNYPKAILIATILIFSIFSIGSISLAVVIPKSQISLGSGTISAFSYFLKAYHLNWIIPILGILMTFGALGMLNTWTLGPARGLLTTAQEGELPAIFRKVNKKNMPVSILLMQALISTLLGLVILFEPTINQSYFLLYDLTALLYLLMYLLLFASFIRLRFKYADHPRPFKVPFKSFGMWLIGGIALSGVLFCLLMGFFPPEQIEPENIIFYEVFLIGGIVIFAIIPFVIHRFFHKKWKERIKD
ncbi:MAG: hypothetical protein AMS24_00415 [Chlamydiae bacterium SM23_39]|nr:MAG: hypothetical protein AMS24_00415 [Chlamydiae bacterium SM23_39]